MYFGFITKVSAAVGLSLVLAACGGPPRAPSIGEAFVGPAELKIRSDIPLESSTVATVRHGERLEILQQRRQLFLRVRTPNGAEGWTDARQLLGAEDMANRKELAERARSKPSQGVATTYSELRVHTQPSRRSPSFLMIRENEKVDVLSHVVAPRADAPRKPLVPPAAKKTKAPKKPAKPPKYPPPPMPKPPGPPPDWLELSKTDLSREADDSEAEPGDPPAPVPSDDWSLVRTGSGQAGWALTRALYMAIPDDVAQYAEGHRIVSYFSLGEVADGDQTKHDWLWTTISGGPQPYDFDSFRVFIWSLRRHRYETAYIERNLRGYSPVLVKQVEFATNAKGRGQPATEKYPGFSICIQKADGQRYRREYAFLTNIVRFAGERPCEAAPLVAVNPAGDGAASAQPAAPAPQPKQGLAQRLKSRWTALKKRVFGK